MTGRGGEGKKIISRIALVGLDRAVSMFCVRALMNSGYRAYSLTEQEAVAALRADPPELLIVSRSLERHDWQDMARAGRAGRADMRLLLISSGDGPASPYV